MVQWGGTWVGEVRMRGLLGGVEGEGRGPGGGWPCASGVEGRTRTPTWRDTGTAAGRGTPEVGQGPDGARVAKMEWNGMEGEGGWEMPFLPGPWSSFWGNWFCAVKDGRGGRL